MASRSALPAWLEWLSLPFDAAGKVSTELRRKLIQEKLGPALAMIDAGRLAVLNHARTPPRGFRRVFGRVKAADVSCPSCGWVGAVWVGARAGQTSRAYFDHRTGCLTCPTCQKRWQVGLVYWQADGEARGPAEDARPTAAEVLALRAFASVGTDERAPIVEGMAGRAANVEVGEE